MANSKQFNGAARLMVQIMVILVTVAVAWGIASHKVADNTADIANIDAAKLDKEVFAMYIEQQEKASEKRDKMLERMDVKLDKALAK